MSGLRKIISLVSTARRTSEKANARGDHRLRHLEDFGINTGNLDAKVYEPNASPMALVVVLHGCTQNASVYDMGSGWSKLAERHGFAVLYPQQRRTNNPNLCFNWYQPNHARRGQGEAASISQMIRHLAARYSLDRSQIFITGLSAGGAMTAVMLASYPELFGGGAIIAGLPFAIANTLPEALERMRGHGFPARRELLNRARAATECTVQPPTLSVWHGTSDAIVDPANASAIVNQWRDLHSLGDAPGRVQTVAGHRREIWSDSRGRTLVERYDIRGLGHGTPLNTRDREACGTVGPHMLETTICSTRTIAASWGLVGGEVEVNATPVERLEVESLRPSIPEGSGSTGRLEGVGAVIENALRVAGLMR